MDDSHYFNFHIYVNLLFMSFSRVPEQFLRGIFLAPHNFSDPQNPQHGQFVNLQLRNDLYFSTLHQITTVQFGILPSGQEQWLKVDGFSQCKGELPWFNDYANRYKKWKGRTLVADEKKNVEMIACEEWRVVHHKGSEKKVGNYRVHFLQSDSDIFKTEIFPTTLGKTVKDLLLN